MYIKENGKWNVVDKPQFKFNGFWITPDKAKIKQNGQWYDYFFNGVLHQFYNTTVTVGNAPYGTEGQILAGANLELGYGYIEEADRQLETGEPLRYFSTSNQLVLDGVVEPPPFTWVEMSVHGDLSATTLGNIVINGEIGKLYHRYYSEGFTRSYIVWVFETELPTSGSWDIQL